MNEARNEPADGKFAAYPRPPLERTPSERLEALAEGYRGLNRLFGLSLGLNAVGVACLFSGTFQVLGAPMFGVSALIVGGLTYLRLQSFRVGANWSEARIIVASLIMALNSFLFGGILEFAILQQLVTDEMKKLGVRSGFLGPTDAEIARVVSELRARSIAEHA